MAEWDVGEEDSDGYDIAVDGSNSKKDSNIVKHLISSYGGITALMVSMSGILKHVPKLGNSKFFVLIGKIASISVVLYDLYTKVSEFYKRNSDSVSEKKRKYIDTILKKDSDNYAYRYDPHELRITPEHIGWLISPHNDDTGGIVVKSYYDLTVGKQYDTLPMNKAFSVLVEFKHNLVLIEIDSITLYDTGVSYLFKKAHTLDGDNLNDFADTINAKYMESVGFDKNVLLYDGVSIGTRTRSNFVTFDIASVNFDVIVKDISTILDNNNRRGYLFVGPPGTGKTTILLKLEQQLTHYPILYITASNLNDEYAIGRLETFIHNLGKCLVFIEDMDSLEISNKTKRIAPILSLLDSSRRGSSVVFVATINNASLITPSIARTGRFDEIIEVHEPKDNNEIFDIMKTSWEMIKEPNIYLFPQSCTDISSMVYFNMKRHKLTQSDYCELMQKISLKDEDVNNTTLNKAVKELIKSKKAFTKYSEED